MDDEKQDFKAYSAKNLMIVLYYGNVTKVKKLSINNSKIPLLITDRQILFFNNPKKDPCLWLNIKSLSYTEKQIEIIFENKKEMVFSLPKGELLIVFGTIIDLLRRILSKKQKEKIQLNQYLSPHQKSFPTSGFSLISRFLGNTDIHSINGKKYIETLQSFLMIQSPLISNLYFTPLDAQEEVIPLLLDLIPFIRAAEHFQIVNSSSTFQLLTKYISHLDNIVHLSISTNQDKENFGKFISELESERAAFEGIDFASIQFEEEEFKSIYKVIKSLKMCSLGLNSNSISKKYLKSNKFYDDFESNNYLLYLNFNNFFNLDFAKIAPKIRHISILSIANCNIEISSIFQILKDEEFPNLSEIDISGNIMNQQISSKNVFPRNLYKIVANKIEWKSSEYLRSFFSFVFKQMNSILSLSVSEISFLDRKSENWNSLFQYLSLIDDKRTKLSSISSFCWDGNILRPELFDFLRNCRKLENLSLSYCIKSDSKNESVDDNSISLLCEYLKSAKTIKKLILRGSSDCKLGQLFSKHIVKSVEEMKQIKQIDVSDNSIGDDGINSLKSLIKKKQQIETIVFDNSQPQTISPILSIFSMCNQMAQSHKKIKLSFPIRDINALRESKKVQKKELKLLKSYCQSMIDSSLVTNSNSSSYSSESQIPFPKPSPLDSPYFTFYSFHMLDDFQLPKYIKRGSYRKVELKPMDDGDYENDADVESDDNHEPKNKKKKKERTRNRHREREAESDESYDDEYNERSRKRKKNNKKSSEKVDSDSFSDKNDSKQRKRRKRSRDDYDDDDDEYEQRRPKRKDKSPNRRKSDTRFIKSKNRNDRSESDDDEAPKNNRNRLKNTTIPSRRNKKRNTNFSSSSENGIESDQEKSPKSKKKSYDEPSYDESDNENELRQNKRIIRKKTKNEVDSENEDDQNEQKKWPNCNNKKDLSKSLVPKRRRNIQDNEISNNDSQSNSNIVDVNQKDNFDWSFPFQPVSIPADNNSYVKSIDNKYSIVALTKLITND